KLRTTRFASSSKKVRSKFIEAPPNSRSAPLAILLPSRQVRRSSDRAGALATIRIVFSQTVADSKCCRLCPVGEAQLGEDIAHVVAHRLLAEKDDGGDLLIGLPFGDEAKEPALFISQRVAQITE